MALDKHFVKVDLSDGHYYYDASLDADPDVLDIMIRAQANQTKEGYWRDVATDLAALVDRLKAEVDKMEAAWEVAVNMYPDLESVKGGAGR